MFFHAVVQKLSSGSNNRPKPLQDLHFYSTTACHDTRVMHVLLCAPEAVAALPGPVNNRRCDYGMFSILLLAPAANAAHHFIAVFTNEARGETPANRNLVFLSSTPHTCSLHTVMGLGYFVRSPTPLGPLIHKSQHSYAAHATS